MNLHEISDNYLAVQDIEDVDINDTLDAIEGEFESKAESIVKVIVNIESDMERIENEIKRLKSRSELFSRKIDGIKDYLRANMERTGIKNIKGPLFTITCAAGRDVVVIDNVESLPDHLVSVKTSISPDKVAILEALKAGPVDGAHIEKSKSSIRIK